MIYLRSPYLREEPSKWARALCDSVASLLLLMRVSGHSSLIFLSVSGAFISRDVQIDGVAQIRHYVRTLVAVELRLKVRHAIWTKKGRYYFE